MATTQPAFICATCARSLGRATKTPSISRRALSSSSAPVVNARFAAFDDRNQVPRWKRTPPAMKMPFRVRPEPSQPVWRVNDDQEVLDTAIDNFVGEAAGRGVKGRDLLPQDVKWISLTHKSHAQGAQGFNDRLAFLGKRILDLQTSKALLEAPTPQHISNGSATGEDRLASMQHPALQGVENISAQAKHTVLSPTRLVVLAKSYGIDQAVRWKPKHVEKIGWSGIDGVLVHTMCAIIGALALTNGGKVAADVARQRILKPLGL